ncbi:hypothetical protein GCK72_022824 [Caenorhabditis remanei]|uniref:Uncharacterized protein n=1 Tax=Caenorhabditis remanei TaxID=31234 RepID=A0A6A5FUQ8_CAERE|nr:hypothetical protein GCK72_022824 [Caenorhabditis remanei]KAF1746370.1 hypothetical protein GCK72_022824 [Caenorhabditis remanei]
MKLLTTGLIILVLFTVVASYVIVSNKFVTTNGSIALPNNETSLTSNGSRYRTSPDYSTISIAFLFVMATVIWGTVMISMLVYKYYDKELPEKVMSIMILQELKKGDDMETDEEDMA